MFCGLSRAELCAPREGWGFVGSRIGKLYAERDGCGTIDPFAEVRNGRQLFKSKQRRDMRKNAMKSREPELPPSGKHKTDAQADTTLTDCGRPAWQQGKYLLATTHATHYFSIV